MASTILDQSGQSTLDSERDSLSIEDSGKKRIVIYAKYADKSGKAWSSECIVCNLIEPTNEDRYSKDFEDMVLHNIDHIVENAGNSLNLGVLDVTAGVTNNKKQEVNRVVASTPFKPQPDPPKRMREQKHAHSKQKNGRNRVQEIEKGGDDVICIDVDQEEYDTFTNRDNPPKKINTSDKDYPVYIIKQ